MNLLVRRSALVKREAYSRLRTNTQNLRFCVLLRHQHFFNPRNHASHLTASHFSCVHWLCGSLYSGQCTQRAYFKAECMIVWVFFIISLLIGGNILFTYWCWTLDFFFPKNCCKMCFYVHVRKMGVSSCITAHLTDDAALIQCLLLFASVRVWTIILLSMADWVFTPLPTPWLCVCICVCVWAVGDPSLGWRTWWPPCSMPPRNKGFSCGC